MSSDDIQYKKHASFPTGVRARSLSLSLTGPAWANCRTTNKPVHASISSAMRPHTWSTGTHVVCAWPLEGLVAGLPGPCGMRDARRGFVKRRLGHTDDRPLRARCAVRRGSVPHGVADLEIAAPRIIAVVPVCASHGIGTHENGLATW